MVREVLWLKGEEPDEDDGSDLLAEDWVGTEPQLRMDGAEAED